MNNHVPFLDLVTPHREMEEELTAVVQSAMRSGRFIGGPMVEEFEQEFARFCGARWCIGVGSGTDALRFALIAAGVRQGDLVLTVPFTFIATTEAITQAGAGPVFTDIDPRTYTMDTAKVREFLETQCRRDDAAGKPVHTSSGRPVTALVPVHLYGQMADLNALSGIAAEYGLALVEDACQAHGAALFVPGEERPRRAGSIGTAAAFSFYPGKNLGACGEGGAVTTNDEAVALTVRMLRDHGQIRKYVHVMEGYNGRLDAIQAGILSVKLRRLDESNEQRRRLALRYNELLRETAGITVPFEPAWSRAVYHLYCILAPSRSELQTFLSGRGIDTGLHYPLPLHLQQAYDRLGYKAGDFPAAEQTARSVLSLPLFPGMSEEQQLRVVESMLEFRLPVPQPA